MEYLHFKNYFISFVMLIAVICIIQPVFAQAGMDGHPSEIPHY